MMGNHGLQLKAEALLEEAERLVEGSGVGAPARCARADRLIAIADVYVRMLCARNGKEGAVKE